MVLFRTSSGSRAAATSKMERFQPVTIITKRSILDVAAALDPALHTLLVLAIIYVRNLSASVNPLAFPISTVTTQKVF